MLLKKSFKTLRREPNINISAALFYNLLRKVMLSKETLIKIADNVSLKYNSPLEKAHLSSDAKEIASIMEEASTFIIKEITENKGMGKLHENFNALVTIMLSTSPRFCYYFDMLHAGRFNNKGE
jgi:hypothetical protein